MFQPMAATALPIPARTQYIIVERCRQCGVCGLGGDFEAERSADGAEAKRVAKDTRENAIDDPQHLLPRRLEKEAQICEAHEAPKQDTIQGRVAGALAERESLFVALSQQL